MIFICYTINRLLHAVVYINIFNFRYITPTLIPFRVNFYYLRLCTCICVWLLEIYIGLPMTEYLPINYNVYSFCFILARYNCFILCQPPIYIILRLIYWMTILYFISGNIINKVFFYYRYKFSHRKQLLMESCYIYCIDLETLS